MDLMGSLVSETEKILETEKLRLLTQKWLEKLENMGLSTAATLFASHASIGFGNVKLCNLHLQWQVEGSIYSVEPYLKLWMSHIPDTKEEVSGVPTALQVAAVVLAAVLGGEPHFYYTLEKGYRDGIEAIVTLTDGYIRVGWARLDDDC